MLFQYLPCVWSVGNMGRVSPMRLASVSKVTLAGKVACLRWIPVVPVWYVPVGVLTTASVSWWVSWASMVVGWGVGCMPPIVAGVSAMVGLVVWSWLFKVSSLAVSVIKALGSVPMVVIVMWLGAQPVMVVWCSWWGDLVRTVLGYVAKVFAVITLCIKAVVTDVAWLTGYKTPIIFQHHIDCRWCQGDCNLCHIEFFY